MIVTAHLIDAFGSGKDFNGKTVSKFEGHWLIMQRKFKFGFAFVSTPCWR